MSERTFTAVFALEPTHGDGPWYHVEENVWSTRAGVFGNTEKRYTVYEKRDHRKPHAVISFKTLEEAVDWVELKVDNL